MRLEYMQAFKSSQKGDCPTSQSVLLAKTMKKKKKAKMGMTYSTKKVWLTAWFLVDVVNG